MSRICLGCGHDTGICDHPLCQFQPKAEVVLTCRMKTVNCTGERVYAIQLMSAPNEYDGHTTVACVACRKGLQFKYIK